MNNVRQTQSNTKQRHEEIYRLYEIELKKVQEELKKTNSLNTNNVFITRQVYQNVAADLHYTYDFIRRVVNKVMKEKRIKR